MTGAAVLSALVASSALADPAADAMAKLNDLSRPGQTGHRGDARPAGPEQAGRAGRRGQQLTQARADVSVAQTQLSSFQTSVDKVAAATYMGRTDGMAAILTAESPRGLIDKLAMRRVMATQMSAQMTNYRRLAGAANTAQATAAKSAADAKTAAEQECRGAHRPAGQAEQTASCRSPW